jgi:hypothetical protein
MGLPFITQQLGLWLCLIPQTLKQDSLALSLALGQVSMEYM